MRNIRNATYNNIMAVAHRIQREKGYDLQESCRLAKGIIEAVILHPMGMNINGRINQMLTKEEAERENQMWRSRN